MANWQVVFIDKGNCELFEPITVECYRGSNAAKIAHKQMSEEQEKLVQDECTTIKITKTE